MRCSLSLRRTGFARLSGAAAICFCASSAPAADFAPSGALGTLTVKIEASGTGKQELSGGGGVIPRNGA